MREQPKIFSFVPSTVAKKLSWHHFLHGCFQCRMQIAFPARPSTYASPNLTVMKSIEISSTREFKWSFSHLDFFLFGFSLSNSLANKTTTFYQLSVVGRSKDEHLKLQKCPPKENKQKLAQGCPWRVSQCTNTVRETFWQMKPQMCSVEETIQTSRLSWVWKLFL